MKRIFLVYISVLGCLCFCSCGVMEQLIGTGVQIAGQWLASESISRAEEEHWVDEQTIEQAKEVSASLFGKDVMQSRTAWKNATLAQKISMIGDDAMAMTSSTMGSKNQAIKDIIGGYRTGWRDNFAYADSLRLAGSDEERERLKLNMKEYNRTADSKLNRQIREYRVNRMMERDPEFDCYYEYDEDYYIHPRPVSQTAQMLRERYGDDVAAIEAQEESYWAYLEQRQQGMLSELTDDSLPAEPRQPAIKEETPVTEVEQPQSAETVDRAETVNVPIRYKVQVLARYSPLNDYISYFTANYSISVKEERYRFRDKILYQYVSDEMSFKEASDLRKKLIDAGIDDAWIVGYENGIRVIPVGEEYLN